MDKITKKIHRDPTGKYYLTSKDMLELQKQQNSEIGKRRALLAALLLILLLLLAH